MPVILPGTPGEIPKRPTRTIHTGRDYFEHVSGNVTTGASIHGDHAQQLLLQNITPNSSKDDILKLLSFIQEELPKLPLPEEVKEEVVIEVKAAEIQTRKDQINKEKVAERLKDATEALKESTKTIKETVTIGNLLGKVILWCGEQWMDWM